MHKIQIVFYLARSLYIFSVHLVVLKYIFQKKLFINFKKKLYLFYTFFIVKFKIINLFVDKNILND